MHGHMLVRSHTTRAGPRTMPKTSNTPNTEQANEAAVRRKLKGTNIEFPAYVWEQVRAYLDEHPEQRVRHMVMAGFQALGLKIDPEDLVAERRRGPGG
jgi:Cdc6-like AAA superfamily ATPase